jgi:hypothetical protein
MTLRAQRRFVVSANKNQRRKGVLTAELWCLYRQMSAAGDTKDQSAPLYMLVLDAI